MFSDPIFRIEERGSVRARSSRYRPVLLSHAILSEAKDLASPSQILHFVQDDNRRKTGRPLARPPRPFLTYTQPYSTSTAAVSLQSPVPAVPMAHTCTT